MRGCTKMANFLLVEVHSQTLMSFILPKGEATGGTALPYEHGDLERHGTFVSVVARAQFHGLPIVLGRGLTPVMESAIIDGAAVQGVEVLNNW